MTSRTTIRSLTVILGVVVLAIGIAGCGADRRAPAGGNSEAASTIRIVNAVVPEPPTDPASAYMTIKNSGDEPDRLLRVQSDAAKTTELHQTRMNGAAMSMVRIDAIEVPARSDLAMQPGGYHLMLIDLTHPLRIGGQVTLTLTFERAGVISVVAPVVTASSIGTMHR